MLARRERVTLVEGHHQGDEAEGVLGFPHNLLVCGLGLDRPPAMRGAQIP